MNMVVSENTYLHIEKEHNVKAAEQVVPYLIELFNPSSVLDIGCGIGTWLWEFKQNGVKTIMGVDIPYVDNELLSKFLLSSEFNGLDISKPFNLHKTFDLVICLEVAEHLPEQSADGFIRSLTCHGDIIIFSAAVPFQEGQNHINEQWPAYWQSIFKRYGFEVYDIIRDEFWNNDKVDIWYRQNILVYARPGSPALAGYTPSVNQLARVHPELFENRMRKLKRTQDRLSTVTTTPDLKTVLKLLMLSFRKIGKKMVGHKFL